MNTVINQSRELTREEAEAFGEALDAIRDEVMADLGQRDVEHMRKMIKYCRYAEVGGRGLLHFGIGPLSFVLGTSLLTLAKILDNMEIGHNIMHGQYDWSGDPELDGASYEWDNVCPSDDWRHYHNFEHHTFTNIYGKDRDIGYELVRITEEQPWTPYCLIQLGAAALMSVNFQWGIGTHDLRIEEVFNGKQTPAGLAKKASPFLLKSAWQLFKDYAFFPAIAGLNAPRVALGNGIANGARSLWTFVVIFCGHFPEGARIYSIEETENENRGQWYARQVNGSVNIEGSHLFHVMTGHLSHQIEHHLFPDLPAARYPEIAGRVRATCEKFGQAYNTGSFSRQVKSVIGKIAKYSLPTFPSRESKKLEAEAVEGVRAAA